jgi:hypothetical protein
MYRVCQIMLYWMLLCKYEMWCKFSSCVKAKSWKKKSYKPRPACTDRGSWSSWFWHYDFDTGLFHYTLLMFCFWLALKGSVAHFLQKVRFFEQTGWKTEVNLLSPCSLTNEKHCAVDTTRNTQPNKQTNWIPVTIYTELLKHVTQTNTCWPTRLSVKLDNKDILYLIS